MANIGHLEATLGLNFTQLTRGISRVRAQLAALSKSMARTGRMMTLGMSLPLALLGGSAVKTFADFQKAMNQVKAVSQATETQMASLEGTARQLGATTKFTATQAAEGMSFLAMAGFEVNEVIAAMPATLNLAAAGGMELGRAADHVSNIMQGFGRQAEHTAEVTDVLTATFTKSNTSLEQLGEAMSYAAPVAKAMGQSIATTSAAIGMLSDAGIQASRAGTGLRQIFTQLVRKQHELGISITNMHGGFMDLSDILQQIERRGLTTAEVFAIMGPRAGTAMAALMDRGSAALRRFSDEVANAGGLTESVAKTQMQGLAGAFIELKSAAQELFIAFSEQIGGGLEKLVDRVKQAIRWLGKLDGRTKRIIIAIAGLAAAIGPAVFILGKLIALLVGLASPVGLAIAAIAALAAAFLYVRDNWEAIKERLGDWAWWRNALIDAAQFLIRNNPITLFNKLIDTIWEKIKDKVTDISWWKHMLIDMAEWFIRHNPFSLFQKALGKLWDALDIQPGALKKVEEGLKRLRDEIKENKDVIEENPFEALAQSLEKLRGGTKGYQHQFRGFTDSMKRQLKEVGDFMDRLLKGAAVAKVAAPKPGVGKVKGEFPQRIERGGFAPLIDVKPPEKLLTFITDFQKQWEATMGSVSLGTTLLSNAFQGMSNAISDALNSTENVMQAFLKFFIHFIESMIIKLVAAIVAATILAIVLQVIGVPTGGIAGITKGMKFGKMILKATKSLAGLQEGGYVTSGGLFRVGERGPELVSLPAGTAVTPAAAARHAAQERLSLRFSQRRMIIELDRERERINR